MTVFVIGIMVGIALTLAAEAAFVWLATTRKYTLYDEY